LENFLKNLSAYFFFVIFFLTGCGKSINDPERIISRTDVDMDSMRWDSSSFPIMMKISNNFDLRSQTVAQVALYEWERASNIDFFTELGTIPNLNLTKLSDYYYKDKYVNGIYLAQGPVDDLQAPNLAVTQIIFYTNKDNPQKPFYQILHTDIVLNGHEYEFTSSPFDNGAYYLLTLILHEVGHVLGLGHEYQGIMYPSMSTLDKQETLTTFDENLIQEKYDSMNPPVITAPTLNSLNQYSDVSIIRLYLPDSKISSNFYRKK
jgi:hypothetical protein